MGFPLMVYRGGRVMTDYRICDDENEVSDAADAGYLPLDMLAFMAAKGVTVEEPAEEVVKVKPKKGRK